MTASFSQEITRRIDHFENYSHVLEGLRGLILAAKELHAEERKISLLSVRLVGLLVEQNGAGNCMMNQERFAWFIGLTPNQFWKRSQTYRILKKYPEFTEMIERGETCVSHVSMLSKKITPANAEILRERIKLKSTREVRDIVASITEEGTVLEDKQTFIDIHLRLTKSQLELLERAREVLAHGGSIPANEDIILKALGELLERKDPLKKAERAEKRAEKNSTQEKPPSARKDTFHGRVPSPAALKKDTFEGREETFPSARKEVATERPKIPAATKHLVWQRDKGYCTHEYSNGMPCGSRMMIEIDHIIPWARGGTHDADNLTLKCREHNQWSAVEIFGREHMTRYG